MCNCGKKRNEYEQQNTATKNIQPSVSVSATDINFQYTGKTALTVIGSISGKRYRFGYPGAVQLIDHRDITGMMEVPVVRKMK